MNKPDALAIAFSQIGIQEVSGNLSNPKIDEYLEVVGLSPNDSIPWCAAFVNWCLKEAGIEGTGIPNARSFLDWGLYIEQPTTGCICVLKRGFSAWQGHVGFYLDHNNEVVFVLGGNQYNRVGINGYSEERVLGFRIPKGKEVNT